MIARVTWGKIKPGKWDEFKRLWQDYSASEQGAGATGRLLLRDSATPDAGYSISLWESEEAFQSSTSANPPPSAMIDCFVGQYVTTITEVSGSTFAGIAI